MVNRDHQIIRMVWQLGNALVKFRNQDLLEYGLTSVQAEVISFLLKNRDEHVNMQDVQNNLMLTHPTVIGIVKRLESKGLIILEKGKPDARCTYLRLTANGALFENILDHLATENAAILLRGMTDEEQKEFYRLLQIAQKNVGS
ncbi:MAG TPA: MarR family transcriptional regulator [Desulfitobacteriaceae bacterium]|nr:MarR family transcriptional regulator [Desulfitobacteriaceae bacterium]